MALGRCGKPSIAVMGSEAAAFCSEAPEPTEVHPALVATWLVTLTFTGPFSSSSRVGLDPAIPFSFDVHKHTLTTHASTLQVHLPTQKISKQSPAQQSPLKLHKSLWGATFH